MILTDKVGEEADEHLLEDHGLEVRNERGEKLVKLCKDIQFPYMNTLFQLPPHRLCTSKAP